MTVPIDCSERRSLAYEMDAVSLTYAKAHPSELVDRIEARDSIRITRRSKPVARLTAIANPRQPMDSMLLQSLTAAMPPQFLVAGNLVRSMRDGDRYPALLKPSGCYKT